MKIKYNYIEHKKQRIVGHIVSAGFSGYGDNELLDEEAMEDYRDPFNISLGAVVYRMVDKKFAELLNKSVDPESPMYNQVSASWEIGFNETRDYIYRGSLSGDDQMYSCGSAQLG